MGLYNPGKTGIRAELTCARFHVGARQSHSALYRWRRIRPLRTRLFLGCNRCQNGKEPGQGLSFRDE